VLPALTVRRFSSSTIAVVNKIHNTCMSGGGTPEVSTPAVGGGEMKIQMAIIHPEIIVVENAMTFDTNALILTVSYCSK